MKKRINNILPYSALNIFSICFVLALIFLYYYIGLKDEYFIFTALVTMVVLFPFFDYAIDVIEQYKTASVDPENYINTIDEFMNTASFDDFISGKFSQILDLISADGGVLAIYNREKDKFTTFVHSSSSVLPLEKKYKINSRSILFEVTNSREDIINKSKLNPEVNFNRKIISELDRLDCDLMVPLFYLDIFMGALFVSRSGKDYKPEEIINLKIFATKIASLSVNSFFWQEMARKKELEKERDLGEKVQRNFLPPRDLIYKNITATVHYSNAEYIIDKFYDIFPIADQLNITNYGSRENQSNSIIFMPALKAMLQSFSRLGFNAEESYKKMMKTNQSMNLIEEKLNFLHCCVYTDGNVECILENYPHPFIFSNGSLSQIHDTKFAIASGDLLILCSRSIESGFLEYKEDIEQIFFKYQDLAELKNNIVFYLKSKEEKSVYKFFSICRVESK